MAERNDNRFAEDMLVTFAMYCDEHNLSPAERERLAQGLGDALLDDALEHGDDGG